VRRIRSVAVTEIVLVVSLVGFAGIAQLIEHVYKLDFAVRLSPVAALACAAAPSILWLAVFSLQDRGDPAPRSYVFGVYLLGAFVAGPMASFAVSQTVIEPVVALPAIGTFTTRGVVRAVLLVGLAHELCKYIVVRYTVYLSPQLSEPIDGIIYMSAAALGLATYHNYTQLAQLGNATYLTVGTTTIMSTTVMHVAVAAVMGVYVAKAKFSCTSSYQRSTALLFGLCSAMVLHGLFSLIYRAVSTAGAEARPWYGVAWAGGFAAAMFLTVSVLMRRHFTVPQVAVEESEDVDD